MKMLSTEKPWKVSWENPKPANIGPLLGLRLIKRDDEIEIRFSHELYESIISPETEKSPGRYGCVLLSYGNGAYAIRGDARGQEIWRSGDENSLKNSPQPGGSIVVREEAIPEFRNLKVDRIGPIDIGAISVYTGETHEIRFGLGILEHWSVKAERTLNDIMPWLPIVERAVILIGCLCMPIITYQLYRFLK